VNVERFQISIPCKSILITFNLFINSSNDIEFIVTHGLQKHILRNRFQSTVRTPVKWVHCPELPAYGNYVLSTDFSCHVNECNITAYSMRGGQIILVLCGMCAVE
jgi:hypothetical protein